MSQDKTATNLAHSVSHWAKLTPDAVALVVEGKRYSYRELWEMASRVAAWVTTRTRAKEPVAILASRSLEAYAGVLGACAAGRAYVPINPRWPWNRMQNVISDCSAGLLILDRRAVRKLAGGLRQLSGPSLLAPCLASGESGIESLQGQEALNAVAPLSIPETVPAEAIAYTLFTSGSTGTPKGVCVSVGAVNAFLHCIRELYRFDREERFSQFSDLSFDISVYDIFAAWDAGASTWVIPEHRLMTPGEFIKDNEISIWLSVPSVILFMQKFNQLSKDNFPSLKLSLFAGEPFPEQSVRAWSQACPNSVIENHYGPTEATVMCLYQRAETPLRLTEKLGVMAIGKPYPSTRAGVVDDQGKFLPPGAQGELVLSGPQLASGYFRNPGETEKRFQLLSDERGRKDLWYRTGDLAVQDPDGTYHHLGRSDRQVKVLGHRVELDEIEAVLRRELGTDDVAVVAWPVRFGSAEGTVAFTSDSSVSEGHRFEKSLLALPMYMRPKRIIVLESLPLNTNRKIDRQALLALLEKEVPSNILKPTG